MDQHTRTQLEAAAFRGLARHLQKRSDVQNIDLMNLAGFCRNCLYKWLLAAAEAEGVSLGKDEAQRQVYGMAYDDWKSQYQQEATDEQKRIYAETKPLHAEISGHT